MGFAFAGLAAPFLGKRWGSHASGRLLEARGSFQALLVDGLHGVAELLVLGAMPSHLHAVEVEARGLARSQNRAARAGAAGSALAALATDFTAVAALAAFEGTQGLPAAFAALGAARSAERRLAEVLEARPAVEEPPSPRPLGPGLRLETRDLSFAYPGQDRPTLQGVSLVLEPGRVVALVGASGSGKSTLARLLARFWEVPSGSVFLDGVDVRELPTDGVRARVAVLGQPFHVFGTSLRENLRLARPDATDEDLQEAARFAGLDDLVARLVDVGR